MHLGMHNWMRSEPLEATLARLVRYGYESIEISGEPQKYDVAQVRGLLEQYGIRCWGAVTLMRGDRDMQSSDDAQRARTIAYAKDCVRFASGLGGEIVTLVPGRARKILSDAAPEGEWNRLVDAVGEIYEVGEAEGVRIAIEPLNRYEAYLVTNADQALALCEAVGPNSGVALDAFHINIEEAHPMDSIRRVGDKLLDFHIADNTRMPAGLGNFDWPEIVAVLREVGYDGALTGEFVPPIDRTPAGLASGVAETDLSRVDAPAEQLALLRAGRANVLSEEYFDGLVKTNAETLLPLIR